MKHISDLSQRITNNFEKYNPYAREAKRLEDTDDESAVTYAQLAIAFELAQLRFLIRHKDNNVNISAE